MYAKNIIPSAKHEVQAERSAKRDDLITRPRGIQIRERSARLECIEEANRFLFFKYSKYYIPRKY